MPPSTDKQERDERNERGKAVELAVGQIEKQFGKGSIMRLGQKGAIQMIESIPTGSISIDYALGVGGMPRGRVIEIFGPESSGKTTLALQVIAQAQKIGGVSAFVDAEHALDAAYAKKLGVDLDNLLVSQPDNGEQALEIVEVLIRSNGVDVVVVDSVAALVPRAEIEGEMGDAQMGLQARLMSQALRKLTGAVSKSKTCLIFINQLREKIGVMFGNPETTTGGRALKFYSSVRVDIRRIASIKDGDAVVGGRTRVKVVKNKVAPPFREAEFDVMYGEGISREGDLLDLAVDKRIVEKSGTWFAYGGERLGQGRENAKAFLRENPETFKKIEERVRKELGLVRDRRGGARLGSAPPMFAGTFDAIGRLDFAAFQRLRTLHSSRPRRRHGRAQRHRARRRHLGRPRSSHCLPASFAMAGGGAGAARDRARRSSITDYVAKPFFNRSRPFESYADSRVYGYKPTTRSFPSGHAASAIAGACALVRLAPEGRGIFWVLAVLVAFSRVYLGVHYPADVHRRRAVRVGRSGNLSSVGRNGDSLYLEI